jgi:hypothetical protein
MPRVGGPRRLDALGLGDGPAGDLFQQYLASTEELDADDLLK